MEVRLDFANQLRCSTRSAAWGPEALKRREAPADVIEPPSWSCELCADVGGFRPNQLHSVLRAIQASALGRSSFSADED
jgi:hypothetical protein